MSTDFIEVRCVRCGWSGDWDETAPRLEPEDQPVCPNCGGGCDPASPVTPLRDQFAMAALTGLLGDVSDYTREEIAIAAYRMADAMLKYRKP